MDAKKALETKEETPVPKANEVSQSQLANDYLMRIFVSLMVIVILFIYRRYDVKFEWHDVVLIFVAVIPWLSYFIDNLKLGKDSLELNFLKQKVAEIDSKVENEVVPNVNEAKEIGQTALDAAAGGVGGKTAEVFPSETRIGDKKLDAIESPDADNDDPQRGKWGGSPISNGRELSAEIERIPNEERFRRVTLTVASLDETKRLTGKVTFHLHPSFWRQKIDVPVINGVAETTLVAWGAFTVGAEADNGETQLELNLADLRDGIDPFFDR